MVSTDTQVAGKNVRMVVIPQLTSDMLVNETDMKDQIAQLAGNEPLVLVHVQDLAVAGWQLKDPDRKPPKLTDLIEVDEQIPEVSEDADAGLRDEQPEWMWLFLFMLQCSGALKPSQTLAIVVPESARGDAKHVEALFAEENSGDAEPIEWASAIGGVYFSLAEAQASDPGNQWMKCGPMRLF
jgi:hypothetical protein